MAALYLRAVEQHNSVKHCSKGTTPSLFEAAPLVRLKCGVKRPNLQAALISWLGDLWTGSQRRLELAPRRPLRRAARVRRPREGEALGRARVLLHHRGQ